MKNVNHPNVGIRLNTLLRPLQIIAASRIRLASNDHTWGLIYEFGSGNPGVSSIPVANAPASLGHGSVAIDAVNDSIYQRSSFTLLLRQREYRRQSNWRKIHRRLLKRNARTRLSNFQ